MNRIETTNCALCGIDTGDDSMLCDDCMDYEEGWLEAEDFADNLDLTLNTTTGEITTAGEKPFFPEV